jgi:hypothetical protein
MLVSMLPRHVGKLVVFGAMLCAAWEALCAVPEAIAQQAQVSEQEDDITVLIMRRMVLA